MSLPYQIAQKCGNDWMPISTFAVLSDAYVHWNMLITGVLREHSFKLWNTHSVLILSTWEGKPPVKELPTVAMIARDFYVEELLVDSHTNFLKMQQAAWEQRPFGAYAQSRVGHYK